MALLRGSPFFDFDFSLFRPRCVWRLGADAPMSSSVSFFQLCVIQNVLDLHVNPGLLFDHGLVGKVSTKPANLKLHSLTLSRQRGVSPNTNDLLLLFLRLVRPIQGVLYLFASPSLVANHGLLEGSQRFISLWIFFVSATKVSDGTAPDANDTLL